MSINILEKEKKFRNITLIEKSKQKVAFIRYFLYVLFPYLGGIVLPELLQESLPATEQELIISIGIFFSAQVIVFLIVLREILVNYDYKAILGLATGCSLVTSILYIDIRLSIDYVLVGQSIGFILASICGIMLVQWDSLAYQERNYSNLIYTSNEEKGFSIAKSGMVRTTLHGYSIITIKNIPVSALEQLSTLLLEFECSLEEEYDKIILKYTPQQRCFFFEETAVKNKMKEQYQTFVKQLKKNNVIE